MQTENLETLRSLRNQEKAIKAQIDQVIDAATEEAVACLAEQGLDRGEFNRLRLRRLPQVPARAGGQMARECPREGQRAELRQSPHRGHGRLR